jgi:hypothetical protein
LRPQKVAAGGSSTITVTINGTDGSSASKTFTAKLGTAPLPGLNKFTPEQDITHQEGVHTNRTYSVLMTGISDGDPNLDNPITVTASSSDITMLDNPTVNYASPSSSGTLSLTIEEDGRADATVTVNVKAGDTSLNLSFKVHRYRFRSSLHLRVLSDHEDAGTQSFTVSGIQAMNCGTRRWGTAATDSSRSASKRITGGKTHVLLRPQRQRDAIRYVAAQPGTYPVHFPGAHQGKPSNSR